MLRLSSNFFVRRVRGPHPPVPLAMMAVRTFRAKKMEVNHEEEGHTCEECTEFYNVTVSKTQDDIEQEAAVEKAEERRQDDDEAEDDIDNDNNSNRGHSKRDDTKYNRKGDVRLPVSKEGRFVGS